MDGIFVKGAGAQDAARRHGFRVGIDLDKLPERRFRVNNGTPRPITVHEHLLRNHYDVVVRFLRQVLRASEWAKTNLERTYELLGKEIGATPEGLRAAYRNDFHLALAPDLSDVRVELFRQQKDWLLRYGVLDGDFNFDAWIDRRPIEELRAHSRRPSRPNSGAGPSGASTSATFAIQSSCAGSLAPLSETRSALEESGGALRTHGRCSVACPGSRRVTVPRRKVLG